jgi:LemA protein
MHEKDEMNTIIRRMYAEDLKLLGRPYDVTVRRWRALLSIRAMREAAWTRQSFAVKVAMTSLFLAFLSAAVYYYNFFTINAYQAMMERAQIEAQLQRRKDLIPNLVNAANNYLNYEKDMFSHVAEVRGAVKSLDMKAMEKSIGDKTVPRTDVLQQEGKSVLSKFQAVAEAYPALKASEAYNALMKDLTDTETRIADSRVSYNRIANFYNSRLKMFPGNVFNLAFRFKPFPVFESQPGALEAPRVH